MNPIDKLAQINQQKQADAEKLAKHNDLLNSNTQIQETIVQSAALLVDFLSNNVSKTQVVNQLTEIGTPDAMRVVEAVNDLHETLKTHENTDLSEITEVMRGVLDEVKALPKDAVVIPEAETPIDYTERFEALETAITAVTDAVKAQETKVEVEAPVVNVPETSVNVEAPDLKPLSKDMAKVEKAIKALVFPTFDATKLEKEQAKQTKILEKILDKPVGGGGGGGRATPYETADGTPHFVQVEQGAIPTVSKALAVRIDDTSTPDYTYIGKAVVGTDESATTWQIARLYTSSGLVKTWADGDSSYDNVWDDRTTLTYL